MKSYIDRPLSGELTDPYLLEARRVDARRIAQFKEDLHSSEGVEVRWERQKNAAKQLVRELFSREQGLPVKREDIIEQVTGIRVLTQDEERKVQICGDAISELWGSNELELTTDRFLIPGYNLQPVDKEAHQTAPSSD
ncbi:MAG TPA: hypothetical protein VMR34_01105 [Candidatus Saccharimonadales bacterium]|nr:hypothetical protein [Candidatus Saccharimonadales bacterium]